MDSHFLSLFFLSETLYSSVFNFLQLFVVVHMFVCTSYHVLHKEIDMIDKTVCYCILLKTENIGCVIFILSWLNYLLSSSYYFQPLVFECYKLICLSRNTCNVHILVTLCFRYFFMAVHYANDVTWKKVLQGN